MNRVLAGPIYLFASLSILHWTHVNWQIHHQSALRFDDSVGPCGNVITDPFGLLVKVIGPLAGASLIGLVAYRRAKGRRPFLPFLASPLFFGTSAALAVEAHWLADYGLEIGRIWWLPRF